MFLVCQASHLATLERSPYQSCPISPSQPMWHSRFLSAEAPKVVKVFINLPRSMGFDDAERSEATQVLDLAEEDYKEDGLIPLRYVKFQNVQSVTVRTGQLKSLLNHPE